ncbi:hypothetical protein BZG36_04810 [Bifiguratus adelaidae]|uniref:Cyclin-like domain-containing protein n=1 Tax=Bifiguratus adelaidae TaxID=1938954 RepID=A0A261XTY7_9FUNG|nr:hypothetical protein BZG36_04810 [Bifiguratus adelaidae]
MTMNPSSQWLFKKSDLSQTPSVCDQTDKYTVERERIERAKGVSFILSVGFTLKLPQITLATACVFFHRFYMRQSLSKYPYYDIAATCIFLATKVEETGRKISHIIVVCAQKAQKNDKLTLPEGSPDYERWRNTILRNEQMLLEATCFDLTLEHPYKSLINFTQESGVSKEISQSAWGIVNDSLRFPFCLLFRSNLIAAAAVYLAHLLYPEDKSLKDGWWESFNVTKHAAEDVANELLDQFAAYQAPISHNNEVKAEVEMSTPPGSSPLSAPTSPDKTKVENGEANGGVPIAT